MNWQALASAVVRRRVELGYETRREFVTATGMKPRTMGDIETARKSSYDSGTLARLEQALEWEAGTVKQILGSEPLRPVFNDAHEAEHATPVDITPEMMSAPGVLAHLYAEKLDLAHLIANSDLDAEQRFNIIREHRRRQNEFTQAEEERIRAEIEKLTGQ